MDIQCSDVRARLYKLWPYLCHCEDWDDGESNLGKILSHPVSVGDLML